MSMSGSVGEPVISADDVDDVDGTEKGWPQIMGTALLGVLGSGRLRRGRGRRG